MEQTGEYRLAASRQDVWRALNDPDILCRCIDGCLSMDKLDESAYQAKVKASIGPVRATFDTRLELKDLNEPESYRLVGDVKGGPAGFAKGEALVELAEDAGTTVLRYTVNGNVGGKLAQVGSRLIDGAMRKLADDFFAAFGEVVAPGGVEQVASAAAGPVAPGGVGQRYESSGRWMIWIIMFAVLGLALVLAL